jgi:hypothetical protein
LEKDLAKIIGLGRAGPVIRPGPCLLYIGEKAKNLCVVTPDCNVNFVFTIQFGEKSFGRKF